MQEVTIYMKTASRVKGTGIDGLPVKFWRDRCSIDDVGRMVTKLIKFMRQESFQQYGRQFYYT